MPRAEVKRSLLLFCLFCPPLLLRPCRCHPVGVFGCERWPWTSAESPCRGPCGSVGKQAAAEHSGSRIHTECSLQTIVWWGGCSLWYYRSHVFCLPTEAMVKHAHKWICMILTEQLFSPSFHSAPKNMAPTDFTYSYIKTSWLFKNWICTFQDQSQYKSSYLSTNSYILSVLRHHAIQSICWFFLTGVHQSRSIWIRGKELNLQMWRQKLKFKKIILWLLNIKRQLEFFHFDILDVRLH